MKTSWRNLRQIEDFLFRRISRSGQSGLNHASQSLLKEQIAAQEKAYQLIREHGRAALREEIKTIEAHLFSHPDHQGFQRRIFKIFATK